MLYVVHIHRKKGVLEGSEIFFWNGLWLGFIYVAVFPQTFRGLIQRLQIARVFDLLVIAAFMIITFITFQNRIKIKNLGKNWRNLYERERCMKKLNYPKISIITPSFNQGKCIKETIESVLSQNYPHLEYFVIDGGSTDETVKILKSYGNKIKWLSKKDKGQTNAINKGLKK